MAGPPEPESDKDYINRRFDETVCSDVKRVEMVTGPPDSWNGGKRVYCERGTFIVLRHGEVFPAYCRYDQPAGCWPVFCVGSGREADMTPDERRRCSTLPRKLLYAK